MKSSGYPLAVAPEKVGSYDALAGAGGGFVWDEVLEYRVWCHPELGAPDEENGNDYYYAFASYEEAHEYRGNLEGAEEPVALILQREYIEEAVAGEYRHVKEERVAEWPVEFLSRPRRTASTIPDFLRPDAPSNRLDVIRGLA